MWRKSSRRNGAAIRRTLGTLGVLTVEDARHVARTMIVDAEAGSVPSAVPTTVRLILLTGCRPGEIRRLRWCEIKLDRLTLIDDKTGPRHVLLGEAARELRDSLPDTASGEWVFPGKSGNEPLTKHALYWFWIGARDTAGTVADARLHDLRHAYASHTAMNGESLHIVGRLLGHRRSGTTNRYVHLDDATLSQAAEWAALTIRRKLTPFPAKNWCAPVRRKRI